MRWLDLGVIDRNAAHLQFEYDCFFPRGLRAPIFTPGKGGFDDPALRDVARVVTPVERQILPRTPKSVAEDCVSPAETPLQRFGVWVDQQLVRIEPMPIRRIKGPVNTIAVKQIRSSVRQIGMPDFVGVFRKYD